jgi:hypothetical protein
VVGVGFRSQDLYEWILKVAVNVTISVAGMDQGAYDQMAPALHPLLKKQPGFIAHVAYATPEGFAVDEVWDSKEHHDAWFSENVAPNLPSGDATSVEYTDLHAVVRP